MKDLSSLYIRIYRRGGPIAGNSLELRLPSSFLKKIEWPG